MHMKIKQTMEKTGIVFTIAVIFILTASPAATASGKIFTIGIINVLTTHIETVEGFKTGMTELGYVEGKNVRYIYNGVFEVNDKIMFNEARNLMSRGIDLLVAVANGPAIQAKEALKGTDIPVLAAACGKVVEIGLIKNLKQPEGNVTGVRVAENVSKALEWLIMIAPNAKRIYLPYNPADDVSTVYLSGLDKVASQLGSELVLGKVGSVEEAVAAIERLPKDINAIFRIPSQTLGPRNSELSQAAIRRGLPMGAALPLDDAVLITFGSSSFEMGRQSARLAHQIHQGVKPSELPVETSEVLLTINLKTAEKIGIRIPDDILLQANKIIR